MTSVLSLVAKAIEHAAAGNAQTAAPAAAVLWPDKDGVWSAVLPKLTKEMPELFTFGTYDPARRSGPAIWLKCAIAGTLEDVQCSGVPVIYLPGVSRADLRAIESCPRDLQPLAELQYRGVLWSQVNGKDWTVNAFLSSKNGGLGLDVAQDRATQEALAQALEAGVLLDLAVEELAGRQVNAEWLRGLVLPNPTRDLLVWMNDPTAAQSQWGAVRWKAFLKCCNSDFGFDPVGDGPLVAAEKLAFAQGKWGAVSELYRDSFASFPDVFGLLAKVQPPQLGLFDDEGPLAGYPQANEQKEADLRYALAACAVMTDEQARNAVLAAEEKHGFRRGWLWARMGQSPLALALGHLAQVAAHSAQLPTGSLPAELAQSYQNTGWKVDEAALGALAAVHAKTDVEAVAGALRALYLPWLDESAKRLQNAIRTSGGLGDGSTSHKAPQPEGLCTVFVDGLRYDVAVRLRRRLAELGTANLEARWTSMPSVTASGKAWCSPVAQLIAGDKNDQEFEPRVAADGKALSAHNFRKLLADNGVQPLDKHETGEPSGSAWTESGDLDHYGHEHGVRLARDLDTQLAQIVERVSELLQAGWKRIRIVTDHGWLLMPGGLPKTELPKHQTETKWGRCAVLKDTAHGTPLTFGWDWCKDVQVAYAPGAACFIAGNEYAHGGLSLQECLVPVISLDADDVGAEDANVKITSVTWKGLRCIVEVAPELPGLAVDIRTKSALVSSSVAASLKSVVDGKANVAVADDEHMGSAAIVVVLNAAGEVIQKMVTTVGG
jgi:hypothetical protein